MRQLEITKVFACLDYYYLHLWGLVMRFHVFIEQIKMISSGGSLRKPPLKIDFYRRFTDMNGKKRNIGTHRFRKMAKNYLLKIKYNRYSRIDIGITRQILYRVILYRVTKGIATKFRYGQLSN
ncbi:hypothetical protein ACJX0J_026973 [Zea mays]